jgi:AraC-like DNA-binding protein
MLVVQVLAYNVAAIRLLHRNHELLLQQYSSFEPADLYWLRFFLYLITGTYILSFCITHLLLFGWSDVRPSYIAVQLLITLFIYLMSYRAMLRQGLFIAGPLVQPVDAEPFTAEKYQRSGLQPEQAQQYADMLLSCMANDQLYRDPELSIYQLADKTGISKHHLTQVINEQLNRNFYELVNSYRVEEVKQRIIDPAFHHLTIEAIGQEAGFKSKTAFYANFKKQVGMTPAGWKKSHAGGKVGDDIE